MRPKGIAKGVVARLTAYVAWAVLLVFCAGVAVWYVNETRASPFGNLTPKRNAYLAQAAGHDVVYFGDSRVLCAFHPDLLDPLTGRRSFNLAHWANWLPTQYAFLADVIPRLPRDTVVVWSIGHQNFEKAAIQPVYPIGWRRLPEYLAMGFTVGDLADNLLTFTPPLMLAGQRENVLGLVDRVLARPLWRRAAAPAPPGAVPAAVGPGEDPSLVGRTETYREGGRLVSYALVKTNGAYLRVETDPAYYRERQVAPAAHAPSFAPSDGYLALFRATLALFERHGVRVIVNELEEAPHTYTPGRLAEVRRFMRVVVRAEVESRGHAYIRADFDRLDDSLYFDWNHLNSRGVVAYSAMIAPLLREALAAPRPLADAR